MSLLEQFEYEWATLWLKHTIKQNEYSVSWWDISINPCVSIRLLKQFPSYKWDWSALSRNSNINIQMIREFENEKWDWDAMSSNSYVSAEIILHYADKPWDFADLSRNENITIDVLKQLRGKPWNWFVITQNKNIFTMDIVHNPDLPWNDRGLLWNPNMTAFNLLFMGKFSLSREFLEKQQNNLPKFVMENREHYYGCYHEYNITHKNDFIERKFVAHLLVAIVEFYKNANNYVDENGEFHLCGGELLFANDYLVERIVAY
jgi:hypothetical protein